MSKPACTDEEFKRLWDKFGSPTVVSRELGISVKNVHIRKNKLGLKTWNDTSERRMVLKHDEGRIDYNLQDGIVIVFSDAHYWPNIRTTMHRSLLTLVKQLKPKAIVCNGDAFDGATVSRWAHSSWFDKQKKPSVIEELNAVNDSLEEIRAVSGGADLIWPLGNHDQRYESRLAAAAPEFEGIKGFHLKDHFPHWKPCWTFWINRNTVVTHFYHSGIHATHNNLLKGQCNYVTGHTHSLQTRPWTNAKGDTLWAVDTGCLADAFGDHNIQYQQGRHGNHRSGFAVLTYRNGELLMPELAMKFDEDSFQFRGHILHADSGKIL